MKYYIVTDRRKVLPENGTYVMRMRNLALEEVKSLLRTPTAEIIPRFSYPSLAQTLSKIAGREIKVSNDLGVVIEGGVSLIVVEADSYEAIQSGNGFNFKLVTFE